MNEPLGQEIDPSTVQCCFNAQKVLLLLCLQVCNQSVIDFVFIFFRILQCRDRWLMNCGLDFATLLQQEHVPDHDEADDDVLLAAAAAVESSSFSNNQASATAETHWYKQAVPIPEAAHYFVTAAVQLLAS